MDRADLQHLTTDTMTTLLWRAYVFSSSDQLRLYKAIRSLVQRNVQAADALLQEFNQTQAQQASGVALTQMQTSEGPLEPWRNVVVVIDDRGLVIARYDLIPPEGSVMKKAYLTACPDCIPLPDKFPASCLQCVIEALRGQPCGDVLCTVHCGYTIVGWALKQAEDAFPVKAVTAAPASPAMTNEDAAKHLEGLLAGAGKQAITFDWRQLAATILQLIIQLLLSKPTP